MAICPRCDKRFPSPSIGSHAKVCPVDWRDLYWQKVDKNGPKGCCWLWIGALEGAGYGHFRIGDKDRRAHHIAWEFANGPKPPLLHVLHTCDVRNCVNPAHL